MIEYEGHRWKRIDRDVFHALIPLAYTEDKKRGWTGLDTERVQVCASITDVERGELYTEWGLRGHDLPTWREHRTRDPETGEERWTHDVLVPEQ